MNETKNRYSLFYCILIFLLSIAFTALFLDGAITTSDNDNIIITLFYQVLDNSPLSFILCIEVFHPNRETVHL